FVNGIFGFFPFQIRSLLFQEGHLFRTAELLVADGSNNFQIRAHDIETEIKTNLIVAGSAAAVGQGISSNFQGVFGNGYGLEYPLGAYRQRIGIIFKDIAKNEKTNDLLIKLLGVINTFMRVGP